MTMTKEDAQRIVEAVDDLIAAREILHDTQSTNPTLEISSVEHYRFMLCCALEEAE